MLRLARDRARARGSARQPVLSAGSARQSPTTERTLTTVVFSGPTIAPGEVEERLNGAACLGPAACGDIFRAQAEGARTIVLVDGYFEHTRSVWHKEILWALHQGVRVIGSSSLGALRAVELAPFGMIGVGKVFEWFRDGVLEDDDEVALAHESPDRNYRPISEALVNIRATLASAAHGGALSLEVASEIVRLEKVRFYPSRTLDGLALAADAAHLSCDWDALAHWLATGRVNQKRADALTALKVAAEPNDRAMAHAAEGRPAFDFAYTDAWHEFVTRQARR